MFFGLTNSLATFQTMMDDIFEDLIMEGVVVVYLDDILIFTKTLGACSAACEFQTCEFVYVRIQQ